MSPITEESQFRLIILSTSIYRQNLDPYEWTVYCCEFRIVGVGVRRLPRIILLPYKD
jgi:hypothetical protein